MNVTITFKHLEHTPALDERIREKSTKLDKFFGGNLDVKWVCWVDEQGAQWAEIVLHGPHFECFARASSDSLYKSLDQVMHKAERQVEKHKSKRREHLHTKESQKHKHAG